MNKLNTLLKIVGVALVFSITSVYIPVFLRSSHVMTRLWLRNILYWSSGILAMLFTLLLILTCIFHFKKKEFKRSVILAITTVIFPIMFCLGVFGIINIMVSHDPTPYYWLTGIWATIFTILIVIIFVLLFKRKEVKRFVILATMLAFLPVAFGIGSLSFIMIISESTKEWIVEEGNQKWVYEREPQDPFGGSPHYDVKYAYINWFVRGDEKLNPHELM